jgi:DNA ligase (NAD+)
MDIRGLSEKTLEALISHDFLHTYKDIYHLSEHKQALARLEGMGEKSVSTLLKSIDKSRDVKLENFIVALGIDGIGKSAAKTISDKFNGDYIEFSHAYEDYFDWTELDDFGEITAKNLESYLQKHYKDVNELASEMHFVKRETKVVFANPFNGRTLCVTGKLNHFTRDSINAKIVELGAKATGSVSKNTDYLITNEASGSSKYKKAVELNVPIITEVEFLKMIGEDS